MFLSFLKKSVNQILSVPFMEPLQRLVRYLHHHWLVFQQNKFRDKRISELLKSDIFSSGNVLHGPFKGMHYPVMLSSGSSLTPKLLGSYEKELHDIIEKCCATNYSTIIDIGCAEGYYAIGLAMRLPNAKIYAYDTDPEARKLCTQMAISNNVNDRLKVEGTCTSEMLATFPIEGRGLVICDCEGYESKLFTTENLQHLKNCDIIIETHDFFDIHISANLKSLIQATHDIKSIYSIDDIQKVHMYEQPEINAFSLEDRKILLSEQRPSVMEWLICNSRS